MVEAKWKFVPVDPTDAMTSAAMHDFDTPFYDDIERTYRVMLAAAPDIADLNAIQQAMDDAAISGTGWVQFNADGTSQRIDPNRIAIRVLPAPALPESGVCIKVARLYAGSRFIIAYKGGALDGQSYPSAEDAQAELDSIRAALSPTPPADKEG